MTLGMSRKNKTFSDTEQALLDVSQLLSRLCKSRKANMKLQEIINLTGAVARLSRSLQGYSSDSGDGQGEGYGDPNHIAKISKISTPNNLIR